VQPNQSTAIRPPLYLTTSSDRRYYLSFIMDPKHSDLDHVECTSTSTCLNKECQCRTLTTNDIYSPSFWKIGTPIQPCPGGTNPLQPITSPTKCTDQSMLISTEMELQTPQTPTQKDGTNHGLTKIFGNKVYNMNPDDIHMNSMSSALNKPFTPPPSSTSAEDKSQPTSHPSALSVLSLQLNLPMNDADTYPSIMPLGSHMVTPQQSHFHSQMVVMVSKEDAWAYMPEEARDILKGTFGNLCPGAVVVCCKACWQCSNLGVGSVVFAKSVDTLGDAMKKLSNHLTNCDKWKDGVMEQIRDEFVDLFNKKARKKPEWDPTNTFIAKQATSVGYKDEPSGRGIIFVITDPEEMQLRERLGLQRR